ncbi:GNAT family N-acetyltransferase [Rhizobium leguminosarum]|uniref:GNAT family N-acetyltransferase n=1 Tax=Rhizobium leguminosarum TaxID=384 RepID=A0A6P0B051_RHILE|nr:GNAT family N-acetyltransferase [Rhizobium leguminosarum]MBY5435172.1 GNAT family N-acetyltransferase [Rhizobium leguminosarum]NEI33213.1 GNAT family N-acetyltransferase [Rhizobium leguminosarum]NEI39972.1 GNAT family N-acetyltransferase [Rhizobium leguminosarum]
MRLESERLILRPWRQEDRKPFAAINAELDVVRYLNPLTDEQSNAMLDRIDRHFEDHGWGFWALEEKASGALIGLCGLNNVSPALPFAPAVEIGWRLSASRHGAGYGREAAERSLDFAFNDLKLDRIVSFTVPANSNSWGLMRRLGMNRIGEFDHPNLAEGHPLRHHVLYELRSSNGI